MKEELSREAGYHAFHTHLQTLHQVPFFVFPCKERRLGWTRTDDQEAAACAGRRGGLASADLADAPGGPLPAGIPRPAGGSWGFRPLCTTPDLAAEVTLQPIRRYGFDAAILFSDILMLPWALGWGLRFEEGEGPVLPRLRDEAGVDALQPRRLPEAVAPILETVRRVRAALDANTTLIGFAGGPFTVACYMVEGGGSKDFANIRRMAYEEPRLLQRLVGLLTEATVDYLVGCKSRPGAEAVMLFDSWAGVLSPSLFRAM